MGQVYYNGLFQLGEICFTQGIHIKGEKIKTAVTQRLGSYPFLIKGDERQASADSISDVGILIAGHELQAGVDDHIFWKRQS